MTLFCSDRGRIVMLKLVIPALPPSNNKFLGNSHSFRPYLAAKQEWHWMVRAALSRSGQKPDRPLRHAVVTLRYFFPDRRRRDPDNYSGKFILDALVREGVLADDSFGCVTLRLEAETDKENPRTEVFINAE